MGDEGAATCRWKLQRELVTITAAKSPARTLGRDAQARRVFSVT
ncbi:hypothetical protein [Kribbella sp. NPDC051718]